MKEVRLCSGNTVHRSRPLPSRLAGSHRTVAGSWPGRRQGGNGSEFCAAGKIASDVAQKAAGDSLFARVRKHFTYFAAEQREAFTDLASCKRDRSCCA